MNPLILQTLWNSGLESLDRTDWILLVFQQCLSWSDDSTIEETQLVNQQLPSAFYLCAAWRRACSISGSRRRWAPFPPDWSWPTKANRCFVWLFWKKKEKWLDPKSVIFLCPTALNEGTKVQTCASFGTCTKQIPSNVLSCVWGILLWDRSICAQIGKLRNCNWSPVTKAAREPANSWGLFVIKSHFHYFLVWWLKLSVSRGCQLFGECFSHLPHLQWKIHRKREKNLKFNRTQDENSISKSLGRFGRFRQDTREDICATSINIERTLFTDATPLVFFLLSVLWALSRFFVFQLNRSYK